MLGRDTNKGGTYNNVRGEFQLRDIPNRKRECERASGRYAVTLIYLFFWRNNGETIAKKEWFKQQSIRLIQYFGIPI